LRLLFLALFFFLALRAHLVIFLTPYFFIPMLAATASGFVAPLAFAISAIALKRPPCPALYFFLASSYFFRSLLLVEMLERFVFLGLLELFLLDFLAIVITDITVDLQIERAPAFAGWRIECVPAFAGWQTECASVA